MRGLLVAIIVMVGIGVYAFVRTSDLNEPAPVQTLESYRLATLSGLPLSIPEQFGDTVLVLNSWATWCAFCTRELPDLVKLQDTYGDQITVIAINRQEPVQDIIPYLAQINITPSDIIFAIDSDDTFFTSIAGEFPSMPQTLFIRSDGSISTHKRGFMTFSEMQKFVDAALIPFATTEL